VTGRAGTSRPRVALRLAAVLTLGLAAAVAARAASAAAVAAAQGRERVITIHERQWAFEPGVVSVERGDRVVLKLYSDDVTHGFFLDGYGINAVVSVEQPAEVRFVADRPGRFLFRCSVTCGPFHPYMVGWLVVRPDVPAYAGWAAVAAAAVAVGGFLVKVGWSR
jgi:heme/copper-type cytochrome/quinol oxidase subunit 2